MLYKSEQFANEKHMEGHESVAQCVTSRQTERRGRQAARSSPDEYLREASRLKKHDRDGRLDDPETSSQKTEAEVQNNVMHDRNSD